MRLNRQPFTHHLSGDYKELEETQIINTQEGIVGSVNTPGNTAEQNLTDKTGETKLNVIHTRRGTVKIK